MNLKELIEAAETEVGRKQLAAEIGMSANRLTDWKAGRLKPDATEIAYLARRAGLDEAATLAEIEAQLDPRFPGLWEGILGKLKAGGIAASVGTLTLLGLPHDSQAAQHMMQGERSTYMRDLQEHYCQENPQGAGCKTPTGTHPPNMQSATGRSDYMRELMKKGQSRAEAAALCIMLNM